MKASSPVVTGVGKRLMTSSPILKRANAATLDEQKVLLPPVPANGCGVLLCNFQKKE